MQLRLVKIVILLLLMLLLLVHLVTSLRVSAVVIGTQAKGTHENSVTLGSYSSSAANNFDQTAKALSSFDDKATGTTVNYNGTSSTQKGAVSVGDGTLVRQIQNVGAGRITADFK